MITMSALPRLFGCEGSAVLPRAEARSKWAEIGNDEHADLSQLDELPAELAKYVPAGARSEVKLVYDVRLRRPRGARVVVSGADAAGAVAEFFGPAVAAAIGLHPITVRLHTRQLALGTLSGAP